MEARVSALGNIANFWWLHTVSPFHCKVWALIWTYLPLYKGLLCWHSLHVQSCLYPLCQKAPWHSSATTTENYFLHHLWHIWLDKIWFLSCVSNKTQQTGTPACQKMSHSSFIFFTFSLLFWKWYRINSCLFWQRDLEPCWCLPGFSPISRQEQCTAQQLTCCPCWISPQKPLAEVQVIAVSHSLL